MRIALVAEAMDTGVGQLVFLYAAGLSRRGHDVHVLHSVARTSQDVLRQLHGLPGVKCTAIPMRRGVHGSDARAALAVRRYLTLNGPFDIVHGHSSKGGMLARLAGIGLAGARLYTPHAFYTFSPNLSAPQRRVYAAAERALARLCSAVVCSSVVERRHAEALGIDRDRLVVVHNGLDAPALEPPARERFGFAAGPSVIVGFVGRMETQKAPDVLVKAIAQAAPSVPELRAVMIGDGCLEPSLKALAARLGIADRVLWLGRQPAFRYLSSFDMLVLPSRYEGFSLMPIEAMHAGLPIVCTPVGGIAETVSDGTSGIVVPVDDVARLAAAIAALARDPERRRAMGREARRRTQSFTAARMVASIERLYRATLARGQPRISLEESLRTHVAWPSGPEEPGR